MKNLAYSIIIGIFLFSCSSEYEKQPVDNIILKLGKEKNFTIVLHDMDVEGTFFKTYKHQYKIIKPGSGVGVDTVPTEKLTGWKEVNSEEFEKHELDLGMEIASKTNGKVTKQTSPPGYSNYVGNQQYGSWRSNSSGSSFWAFYGQYAFMSSMLGMHSPIYRGNYNTYRSSYYGSRPYYGSRTSSGAYRYGTYSSNASNAKRNYTKSSSYSSRRSTAISRSSSSYSSKSGSRTSRSGSRYSGSSRSRSSSSGGK